MLSSTQLPPQHDQPPGHALPQTPQLLVSLLVFLQKPPQLVWPAGHEPLMHCPPEHVWFPAQACPQAPQLLKSLLVSRQFPEQHVRPAAQSGWMPH